MGNPVYAQALTLLAAGIAVIPIRGDGTKAPLLPSGHPTFKRIATRGEIADWFSRPQNFGLAILCGPVSGDVEVIDFDDPQAFLDWQELLQNDGQADLLGELSVITRTPTGGTHLWYRCPDQIGGNQKLARRPKPEGGVETLIETRGKGGYALVPPSPANCHELRRPYVMVSGNLADIPTITAEERHLLLMTARALNGYVEPERRTESPRPRQDRVPGDLRPGDDYNQRGDWKALLAAHGWKEWRQQGEAGLWCRPGKEKGISATLGAVAPGILYVFSSNALPLESERSYDLFGAYCALEHHGDFRAAGSVLAAQGFGSPPSRNGNGHAPPPQEEWAPPSDETFIEDDYAPLPDDPEGDDLKAKAKAFDQLKYARLFANQFAQDWMYLESEQWWQYQQTHWVSIPRAHAETAVQRFLMERREIPSAGITPSKRANVLALAEPFLGPVRVDDLNSNYFWIPLANGVYDVETGRMVEHSPAHRITRISSFDFDPAATCPLVEKFFRESLITTAGEPCEEWVDFIFEWCGYCLLADPNRAQTVLLNVGDGGNGKGVFEGLLRRLVGAKQCCTIDVEQLHDPYQRAQMVGRLVGFISELPHKGLTKNGGVLKAISGGDAINARNPTEKVFTFLPTTRLVTSCNRLPATRDLSRGFFRRPTIIEWRNQVTNPNPNLESDLSAELPGFFNLCMAGVRRLMARNWRFPELAESAKLLAEYRHSQDTVAQYLEARCEVEKGDTEGIEYWAANGALHKDYTGWCKESGYQSLDVGEFGKYLTKEGFASSKQKKIGGKVVRMRPGIRLLASDDERLF